MRYFHGRVLLCDEVGLGKTIEAGMLIKEYMLRGMVKNILILTPASLVSQRSAIDIRLPRRFATTIRLEPTEVEREIYTGINNYLKGRNFKKPLINLLLREAGSSPFALKHSLLNMDSGEDGQEIKEIVCNIDRLDDIVKGNALKEILFKNPDEKRSYLHNT